MEGQEGEIHTHQYGEFYLCKFCGELPPEAGQILAEWFGEVMRLGQKALAERGRAPQGRRREGSA